MPTAVVALDGWGKMSLDPRNQGRGVTSIIVLEEGTHIGLCSRVSDRPSPQENVVISERARAEGTNIARLPLPSVRKASPLRQAGHEAA